MSLGKFLNDTVEKAAKEQLQEKAMDVAGEKQSGRVCVRATGSCILMPK